MRASNPDPAGEGFTITTSDTKYRDHRGAKIGWGYYGDTVFMRMAGCDNPEIAEALTGFLGGEGFEVTGPTGPPPD